MNTVGERIKYLRKRDKETQDQLAEFIGVKSGVTISNYENGDREPDLENIRRIALHYGVTSDWLLNGDEAPGTVKEPQPVIYRAGQQLEPKFQFTQQQLVELIKLKGTNPFLYSILESVMELNNKLADKLEAMEKQKTKSMQKG